MIWSRGGLRAGDLHPQPGRVVRAGGARRSRRGWKAAATSSTSTGAIALPAAANSYVNPFAASTQVTTGRGRPGASTSSAPARSSQSADAVVLQTGAPGWPEEGGVLYQLLDGPLKGEVIFVNEGVDVTVTAGQTVQAGQQIATFRPGGSIEIGFADTAGVPLSHGEYYEGKVTESGPGDALAAAVARHLTSVDSPARACT